MLKTETENTETTEKLPYEKPQLHAVDLLAEEVMGGTCKVGGVPCTSTPGIDRS